MKQSTRQWIDKAEGDWDVAQRAYRARKRPNYDAACFHAQQCVEKYLKAKLNEVGIVFHKTHDLVALLNQTLTVEPNWAILQTQAIFLTDFAVQYRYPGHDATKADAQKAIKDCRDVRRIVRTAFGLPV